jgi:hypothetical protein
MSWPLGGGIDRRDQCVLANMTSEKRPQSHAVSANLLASIYASCSNSSFEPKFPILQGPGMADKGEASLSVNPTVDHGGCR